VVSALVQYLLFSSANPFLGYSWYELSSRHLANDVFSASLDGKQLDNYLAGDGMPWRGLEYRNGRQT
jgi:hypothetical protein